MLYKLTETDIEIINDHISDALRIFDYDLKKSSCFKEIQENLDDEVKSIEVEDDLAGQDREEIDACLCQVYNDCIIKSKRDLRVKIKIVADDEGLDITAYLFDAAEHVDDPSYEDRLVIEQELWTLSERREWMSEDLNTEEEIELELEEDLDRFSQTDEIDLNEYLTNFGIWF